MVKRDGVLLWAGQPDARLPPASLAKMMTAYQGRQEDSYSIAEQTSPRVVPTTGSRSA